MLSSKHQFIYIHIPKTGGTTIQTSLLPYSDDEKLIYPHQDGRDSFEVRGPETPDKHSDLGHYLGCLGNLSEYSVITSMRHPVDRLISGVFSPHKWTHQANDGSWVTKEPYWSRDLLENLMKQPNLRPAADYFRIGNKLHTPDFIIRTENLEHDLKSVHINLGLPEPSEIPCANSSAAPQELASRAKQDPWVIRRIEEVYAEDYEVFGYSKS